MGTGMDMRATTKTRVQRRLEKKQAVLLVGLVLVISVVSFVLGVVVGRHGGEAVGVAQVSQPRKISVDDNLVAPALPLPVAVAPVAEKLSFYENLSKDETAPIGSGINLPPETGAIVVEKTASAALEITPKKPSQGEIVALIKQDLAAKAPALEEKGRLAVGSSVAAPLTQESAPLPGGLPQVAKGGSWVVQVFSSRSAADAGMLRDELGGKGYPTFIAEADLQKKGLWYRVLLGPYADKAAAVQAQAYAAEKEKLKGFAKRR